MKMLRGLGVFFIIAGIIIAVCGMIALVRPGSIPLSGGPALAVGLAMAMLGAVTLIGIHAQKVSVIPEGR